jgi:hypothetical protein
MIFSTEIDILTQNDITIAMKFKFTTVIFSVLILASCKTSFRISVKEPSIVRIPSEVRTIGVLNHVTKENSPEKIIEVLIRSQSINGNTVAAERAVEGVLRGLGKSSNLTGKSLASGGIKTSDGNVNWPAIDSLCNSQVLQGILELTEVQTISPVGGSLLASATGQSSTRLEGYLYANIYIANTHEIIERLRIRRFYNIPLSGTTSVIDILNDVKRKQEYYRALGYDLGYGMAQLIYPKWVWVDRDYYTKGSDVLKRARAMIKEGNWDISEKQLLLDIDHYKEKIRGRVLFNLALVKEGQGDVDSAIMYAEKAALECGDKLANNYLVRLRKRKVQIELMND